MGDLNYSLKKALPEKKVQGLLEQADWGQGRSLAHITQQIHKSDFVISVWDETTLAAFARVITDGSYVAMIMDYIVHRDYHGRGVGNRIMKEILGHPDLGSVKKWVVFSPVNQEFFEQFNFERSDEAMVRYG